MQDLLRKGQQMRGFMRDPILYAFQRFSEWTQVQFDKNCYWWAYVSTHVSGILCLVIVVLRFQALDTVPPEAASLVWVGIVLMLIIAAFEFFRLPKLKRWSEQSLPQFVFQPFTRYTGYFFFFAAAFELYDLRLSTALWFSWACIHFFESCTPLPPSEVDRRRSLRLSHA